jgi:hypothetical protein
MGFFSKVGSAFRSVGRGIKHVAGKVKDGVIKAAPKVFEALKKVAPVVTGVASAAGLPVPAAVGAAANLATNIASRGPGVLRAAGVT